MVLWKRMILSITACAVLIVGCRPPGDDTPSPNEPPPNATFVLPNVEATPPWLDQVTLTLPPLQSLRMPKVATVSTETIYTEAQRATRGGQNLTYWPDGNIGFIPFGDQYRFFAANSILTARTVGTLDNPAASVETSNMRINGVSSEFAYAAGGPIYRDPETGMLLMFYHAERHFNPSGFPFHSAIGLAASHDEGESFDNLGIILETNAPPNPSAPCCADVGGGTFAVKDGWFYLYFRDRQATGFEVELAVATAPVDEVVETALRGTTSEWIKNNAGDMEPGISGQSSPLEIGNPQTSWFSASYNTALNQFIMALSKNYGPDDTSFLYLLTSEDGFTWSPRVTLASYEGDLAYPTIINPDGAMTTTGSTFYIYYVTTPAGTTPWPGSDITRWVNTNLERMTVTLTGNLVEAPHEWTFDTDAEGWIPINQIGAFEVRDGALVIEPTGADPYMHSITLGLSSDLYTKIEVRMQSEVSGTGQFFFTATDSPGISEANAVRFPITGSPEFETYTIDMSASPGWKKHIGMLRFDPTDQTAPVVIDSIRLLP